MKQQLEKIRAEAAFSRESVSDAIFKEMHCRPTNDFLDGVQYRHAKSQALIDKLIRVVELIEPVLTANDARRLLPEAYRILSEGE
jgi:hypothetical protein